MDGPDSVEAGADFEVAWTGPDNAGDYIAIVPVNATEWTNTDDYFSTSSGSPGDLTAPDDARCVRAGLLRWLERGDRCPRIDRGHRVLGRPARPGRGRRRHSLLGGVEWTGRVR